MKQKPGETERVVIKTADRRLAKDPGTSRSTQNLNIVTFIRKDDEERDRQYEKYGARREESNLRAKALGRYVFGISEGKNIRSRMSAPIVFTDEDLATVEVLHADPLIIKLRIGDVIVSRVLVDGGSSSGVIFWNAL